VKTISGKVVGHLLVYPSMQNDWWGHKNKNLVHTDPPAFKIYLAPQQ